MPLDGRTGMFKSRSWPFLLAGWAQIANVGFAPVHRGPARSGRPDDPTAHVVVAEGVYEGEVALPVQEPRLRARVVGMAQVLGPLLVERVVLGVHEDLVPAEVDAACPVEEAAGI